MGTFTKRVIASGDDGFSNSASSFDNTSYYVSFGNREGVITYAFFLFDNVTVPPGARIISASIEFKAYGDTIGTVCDINIYFNDADNASAPASKSAHDALARTTAVVNWTPGGWTSGQIKTTVDISLPVQEVINRPGWASGNDLMALFDDNGSDGNANRECYSHDGDSAVAAELTIEYEEFVPRASVLGAM